MFDPGQLQAVSTEGLARLRKFQTADGGWGWWENDASSARMTALVVQGLIAAKAAGMTVPPEMLSRGFTYLEKRLVGEGPARGSVDRLGARPRSEAGSRGGRGAAGGRVSHPRAPHAVYPVAAGPGAEGLRPARPKLICVQNLENGAKLDFSGGTCYLPQNDGGEWNW